MLKLVLIAIVSFNVFADIGRVEEKVYVVFPSEVELKILQSRPELTLDHLSSTGVEVYGPKGTKEWIEQLGVKIDEFHFDLEKMHLNSLGYPSYNQIKSTLSSINKQYPNITKLFSIGKSVEGRDLWVLKISDNVNVDETEPEFKFISSMHGDEITGRELTISLIQDLVSSYGKDQRITDLINNTEIFIMPSMNPDGSEKRQRGNSNQYDLNRNFPNWDDKVETFARRQPETVAVMNFQSQRQFSLSANFHGGAVCVNYPWDSTLVRHPFNDLLVDLSLTYSTHNTPMYNSSEFNRGITNGADWYVVKGGMQDWSYVFHNDLQVTVELSDYKWPPYNQIPQFYQDNKESMISYLEKIHQGAGFKLSSNISGKAKLTKIDDKNETYLGTYNFKNGEFYKVLEDGVYMFDIESSVGQRSRIQVKVSNDKKILSPNYVYID